MCCIANNSPACNYTQRLYHRLDTYNLTTFTLKLALFCIIQSAIRPILSPYPQNLYRFEISVYRVSTSLSYVSVRDNSLSLNTFTQKLTSYPFGRYQ